LLCFNGMRGDAEGFYLRIDAIVHGANYNRSPRAESLARV
jgi:hypothetical protein